MDLVNVDLTFVARTGVLDGKILHCQPIITDSQDLLGHSVPTGMGFKGAFMNLFDDQIRFWLVYASNQHHIMVPFVKRTPTEEELSR